MKNIFQAIIFLFLHTPQSLAEAQTFDNLIHCQNDLGYDSYCKAATGMLVTAQPYHSTFYITYRMSCDPGITSPRPSALKLVIHTENSQKNERTISFRSIETLEAIDGFGPIELIDTRPSELNSKHYQSGCNLSISIDKGKSQRTLLEEREKLEQIDRYLSASEKVVNDEFRLMVLFRGDIMRTTRDKALACLIRKSEGEALYLDLVRDLKVTYQVIFGENYTSEACNAHDVLPEIIDDCPSDSASQICAYKQAYFKSKKKIGDIMTTLEIYRNDPANTPFYDRIQWLSNKIRSQLEATDPLSN